MRLLDAFLVVLCCCFSVVAQSSINDITPCGLGCLVVTVPAAGCSLTDATCQCSSEQLAQSTAACLLQNCTMHDSFILAKVQASICNLPHENRSQALVGVNATVLAAAAFFVILRFVTKAWLSNVLGPDDWIIGVALLLSFPTTYFTITMAKDGVGRHLYDLKDGSLSSILKNFYIAENFYVVILGFVKISVLVFYLRVFPHRWFQYATWSAIALVVVSTMIISLLTIFQCHPVPYFWNRDLHGSCIDINALAYANSGMSIAQDIMVVVLPIPVLSKLQLGRKKKIGVVFMFAVGSFGCIVSMIRLKSLLSFGNSIDPTWDYTMVVIWTIIELAVAMICACFPAIRRLLARFFPRAFDTSRGYDKGTAEAPKSWRPPTTGQTHIDDNSADFSELRHIDTPSTDPKHEAQNKDFPPPRVIHVKALHIETTQRSWYDSSDS